MDAKSIERAAEALERSHQAGEIIPWKDVHPDRQAAYRDDVRTVLAALHESGATRGESA